MNMQESKLLGLLNMALILTRCIQRALKKQPGDT